MFCKLLALVPLDLDYKARENIIFAIKDFSGEVYNKTQSL